MNKKSNNGLDDVILLDNNISTDTIFSWKEIKKNGNSFYRAMLEFLGLNQNAHIILRGLTVRTVKERMRNIDYQKN